MKKKMYQTSFKVQQGKDDLQNIHEVKDLKKPFTALEKDAKARLKEMCPKDKWVGANIVADVVGDDVVLSLEI